MGIKQAVLEDHILRKLDLISLECFSMMIHCISKMVSMRAEHFNSRIKGEDLVPVKCI